MSDCPTCPVYDDCHYPYKPCDCVGQRKFWSKERADMESIPRAPAKPCEYCRGAGEIETDNNGPIGPCPVCRPDAPGDKFEEHQRDAICKGELCPQCLGADIKRVGSAPDGLRMNAAYDCQNPNCLAKWEGY